MVSDLHLSAGEADLELEDFDQDHKAAYDRVLHAQMKADIAWLDQRFHAYGQESRRPRERSLPPSDVAALGNDPAPRTSLERRWQALWVQTARVQTQGIRLEAEGAAD